MVRELTSPRYAAELDAADPLADCRDAFVGADSDLVYLDGNSLGRPLRATANRLSSFVEQAWGGRLIRGWDEGWLELPLTVGDELARVCLGAAPGQTTIGDSTTVLLYKLLRAAVDHQQRLDPRRTEIIIDRANFPTDRYVVEGVAAERGLRVRWVDADPVTGLSAELVGAAVGAHSAVLVLSHVDYRSGHLVDVPAITARAHEAGAMTLWDLSHSVGALPVDLDEWGVDLAVGCTYKYLNAGPGAPAFGYVARRHQDVLTQPVQGWMGHADPFLMGPGYRPAPGMRRFISGTPPVLGMLAVQDMLRLLDRVGLAAVREKSQRLTSYAVELSDAWLTRHGVVLGSPRDPRARGGHVTLHHPRMREVTARLWQRDVLPDFREPDGLRVGLSPLSTSFEEVRRGLAAVAEELSAVRSR